MRRLLVTGGAGFIGSHVVERLIAEWPEAEMVILDKMTYAADYANISHVLINGHRRLVVGDVCDFELCMELTNGVDAVIHLAAESHVDNAFGKSLTFTRSNTLGTHTLLEAARMNGVPLFLHVSTDEVYGEIRDGAFNEASILNPSNPYSASKAAADMLVNSYQHSFKMPIITVRANNIFGIRQFPEKIIPKFLMQVMTGSGITLHGDGQHSRHYLAAEDFADAVVLLIRNGKINEIYNVGSDEEYRNIDIARMICGHFGIDLSERVKYVPDRPFNDARYAVVYDKIRTLGWQHKIKLSARLPQIIEWYRNNRYRFIDIFPESDQTPGTVAPSANLRG